MTAHRPIQAPVGADHAATWSACQRALMAAVTAAERLPDGQRMLGEALCAALDTVGGGAPRHDAFIAVRDEAQFWADIATPMEIEAYVGAGLRRIGRVAFAEKARKRLFMALWGSFTAKQRADFLAAMQAREG